ncbi:MAG: prolyl oligopeptidase family serine peptidase [Dysgonamonadaceae bacterium]|nr:prolyl oligopeptidase family serine peptidase [Dysgonamonadaceae bacterium]
MKRQKLFISLFAFIISIQFSFAQKKQLDHSVYDDWKSLSNISVDNNGRFAATIIQPQEGDSKLFIQNLKTNRPFEYTRIASFALSPDGSYTVGFLKAPFADTRQAKIDKKKPEEMPKDSLLIVNNETFSYTILPNVKSYKTPQELGNYVAYKTTLETDTITTQPADTIITLSVDTTQTESKNNKKKEKDKEVLVLHNLKTHQQDTLLNAKEYIFNKYGNAFATIIEPDKKDSTDTPGVIFIDLNNYSKKRISNEKAEYKSLSFDESGEQLVYLSTQDTSKVEQKVFNLRYFNQKADSAVILATAKTAKLPTNWIFNENSNPNFSKNGKRILLGTAPQQAPKDTTIVDFEVASLDLWHWKDPYLQPQQLNYLSQELKRTYAGIIELDKNNEFTLLANEEMPYSTVSDEGNGRYTLLYSDIPYRLESQWDPPRYDAWIYDLETNKIRSIATSLSGRPSLSAQGNFVFWFDSDKGDWFVYDNRTANTSNITEAIGVNFWNEKNDVPGKPGSYGIAAWGKDDAYVLINDMFDIWKIDPQNETKAQNITQQLGRKDSITFRYLNTDKEKRFVEPNETLLLRAFDNKTKESGFYTYNPKQKKAKVKQHILDKYQFTSITKSKNSDVFVYQKANFNTSPDLYVTNNWWKSSTKLTDINPQMRDYKWGTPELFSWTSYDGIPLQGILYKPEGFDESKKYPVMIYFYEKHSDELYRYMPPAPSASTINIPFYSSRDYIIFTPDIDYTVGQPGEDAYNAVVSGAKTLAENSWIDKENMAIQGQSWGGYQVAYLITKTDMFKAAGAGAPVSNMTSAYGGIRWESGRSRQYQYERGQSRLGVTMNDSLETYIKNSPVFFADKVNTPLLIMHNDNDGAVPWYQGIELFVSLRRLGKPVWMLQYNNEAHNLKERRNRKDLTIRLQQFFDHYLKGVPAPVWMTRGLPATQKGKDWGYELDIINN